MRKADLHHSNTALQDKLETIFQLRRTRSKVNWDREQYFDLLAAFGNPHLRIPPVIHVAGTNGKGSVIAILRAILEAQGLKVHAYTSPHLIHVNERIVLAGLPIDNAYLEKLIDKALAHNEGAPLSFFEITTALAFKAFSEVSADILLLEVGMGGRLDCTNVIDAPLATVINRISMDHTEFLGDNISQIAAEKAGIMKADVPCIIGYQGDSLHSTAIVETLKDAIKSSNAQAYMHEAAWDVTQDGDKMIFSFEGTQHKLPLPSLEGAHQVHNAGLALAALFAIKDEITVTSDAMKAGLQSVSWPGRLQPISSQQFGLSNDTELWLDSGHNDSAGEALATQMKAWKKQSNKPVHLIMGMVETKDIKAFLTPVLPHIETLHIVPVSTDPTSQTKDDIEKAITSSVPITAHDDFTDAIHTIAERDPSSRILIAGSIYLIGDVLKSVDLNHKI